jgi:hypothetical protein
VSTLQPAWTLQSRTRGEREANLRDILKQQVEQASHSEAILGQLVERRRKQLHLEHAGAQNPQHIRVAQGEHQHQHGA